MTSFEAAHPSHSRTAHPVFDAIRRRVPRSERDLRWFTGCLLWLTTTAAIVSASFVPQLAPDNVNFWRVLLGIPAALFGIAHLTVIPQFSERVQDRVFVVSASLGALVNVPLLLITPATWSIELNMLAPVIWAGYFLGRWGTVWIASLVTAVALIPLVFDLQGHNALDVPRLLVFVPVIWAVAMALRVQKQNVDTALARMNQLAYRDPLTGLANLRALTERFAELVAGGNGRFSLLLVDLDNFKASNTIYGHLGGDHALRAVAHQLRRTAPDNHTIARIGGDEFVVLIPGVSGDRSAEMARLYRRTVIAADSELNLPGVKLDASVGMASFPEHGGTLDELLTQADTAMYSEKAKHDRGAEVAPVAAGKRPAWLTVEADDDGHWQASPALTRIWRSRPLYARFSALFNISAASLVLASFAVPGGEPNNLGVAIAVCLGAVLAAAFLFAIGARHRGLIHRVADVATLGALAIVIRLTGGASSPALPLVVVFAVYEAWFWSVRTVGWRLLGPILVIVSPLYYDKVFQGSGWQVPACTLYSTWAITATVVVALTVNTTVLLGIRRRSRELALTDPLTGLPNRRAFAERVAAELDAAPAAAQGQLALVMLDMDNFNEVNSKLGHRDGDKLLQEIGSALAVVARAGDCVARVGGDEFAAVLPNAGVDGARRLAERFVSAVAIASEPVAHKTGVHVTASAGFSLYPLHGSTLDELMQSAADALMAVKRDGKAGTRVSNVVVGV